jgi:N-acetylmuramoyl-L-alanine amidase
VTTRRVVLSASAAVTAGAALGTVLPGAASAAPTPGGPAAPGTRVAGRASLGGRLRVAEGSFPLSHLGLSWQGPAAQVRLRTARGWGRWRTLHGCTGGRDGSPGAAGGSVVLVAPGGVGYEVWVAGGGAAHAIELNTVDTRRSGPPAAARLLRLGNVTVPVPYVSRAGWGADESLRFVNGVETFPPQYFPVQTLTVHHTAGANDDPDPAATIRAIYYFQAITRGWGDIGYHLMIDEAGRVYEARWSGTDGLPVFGGTPAADGRPQMSNGAHVGGFNAGNVGVCLLGDFTSRLPTAAARRSLTRVLAGLAKVCALDPLGRTDYVNPVSGATRTVDTIPGHRDWAATECPGNLFYPELPALRQDVAAHCDRGVPHVVRAAWGTP